MFIAVAVQAAEESSEIDNDFGFEVIRDQAYVTAKLDEKIGAEQTLDIYKPTGAEKLPVILYLHGGGWAFGNKNDVNLKPHYFTAQGFAFVSMNYRLRWDYRIYDQILDIVAAVKWLEREGQRFGLDGSRVVLMGHQAGAHLAALAVTDTSFFEAEGGHNGNIRAVVGIDSAHYDLVRTMKELGSFLERRQLQVIFGSDDAVWLAASPVNHVAESTSLPAFALLYNPESEALQLQVKGFAKALTQADVEVLMIPGSADAPSKTDEQIGAAGNLATIALMTFLRSQL